jgi:hypothetical protein
MVNSGCPSSGCESSSLRELEDPSPVFPQRATSVVKNAVKPRCTRWGKLVNSPPSDPAWINGKWAVLAAAAWWQQRQSSGSKDAAAGRPQRQEGRSGSKAAAAQWWHWQCEDNSNSAAAAGRCLRAHGSSSVAAMSRVEGRQDIGSSCYSRAVAAVEAQ